MYPHEHHRSDQPILDVNNLTVRYGTYTALEGVSFHLHAGERVAVVGPNGAGKSTLFKVVAGVLAPTEGTVTVSGSRPDTHICIGYVPQRSQVDWNFPVNVADVVMMGRSAQMGAFRWPKHADWEFVHRALDTVGLNDLHARQISELSGGQQQRMFIARALAQEAELMLMDEPLSGLDLPAQEGILKLLDTLQAQNVTVMVATHDLDQAEHYFDRVMLLNHRLLGFGPSSEVLNSDKLLQAYGGRLKLVGADGRLVAMDDTCCDDGEEPHA
jgi:manganese/iron transport system ATP-binding protein